MYRRDSFAGEHFTYRTEKYRPPFLLTTQFTEPVPEPSTYANLALLFAIGGIGYVVRRRKRTVV